MAAVPVGELITQIAQVREQPGLPYEESKGRSLEDLRATMAGVRSALIDAINAAPDSAFEQQPESNEGEEVWSVGEIVGHCNRSVIGIGGSALTMIGVEAGDPPEELEQSAETRIMSRDEALSAARAASIEDFYALIPAGADLDKTDTVNFFGTVSGRSWLYFMALHEAEHVDQIKSLD